MNLFDQLVTEALKNQPNLSSLRMVVEKELLHHDILRILSNENLLVNLTFIGGTCLRCCYGGIRLSEDLDFTGGKGFTRSSLRTMNHLLEESLASKYGLLVKVSDPVQDKTNVSTWKIKIETRPEQKHFPAQRINIDICKVVSYERQPMLLLNPYGVDMGTGGLIIQAQSREEIYADKLIAFALRPNRIKYRDLWDILWLHQQGLKPRINLIPNKLRERNYSVEQFIKFFLDRKKTLVEDKNISLEFKKEMLRFLPFDQVSKIVENNDLWQFISYLIEEQYKELTTSF